MPDDNQKTDHRSAPDRDMQTFTMELERSVYVRGAMEQLDFERLLTDAIEAELKRLDAERPKITKEEIDAFIDEHRELLTRLANS